MEDRGQKTEQPTPRRVRKAREEGNFPSAKHFVGAMQFLLFVAILGSYGGGWMASMRLDARQAFDNAFAGEMTSAQLAQYCAEFGWHAFRPLLIAGGALMLFTLAMQLAATRFGVSLKKLTPDLKRLSPLAKLRELPKQNVPAMVQAMVMLPVFGAAVYYIARDKFPVYLRLPLSSVPTGAVEIASSVQGLLWKACLLFLVFGAVDLFRQQRRYTRDLRMSKQEIRDEMKELEGNPQIKMRVRRIRRDLLRRRMMQEIPRATAVVVNPTHYAVAIRYDVKSMAAPMVVAKGKNYLALRIRQKAIECEVPLVENPPLAQALYKAVEVGHEIPADFYRAVAEILAYIFRLMQGRAA